MLIGAPGVGRNELIKQLITKDPEKYRSPVPCKFSFHSPKSPNSNDVFKKFADTSRPMRPGEVPGREYLFVTRDKMESDIAGGKFIEHGEFRGHLYGTGADSVKSIINSGSVCILNPHYQAIKTLRTPQLKPYMIHIKPPNFDNLKLTRTAAKAISTHDENNSRGFTVSVTLYI